MHEFEIREEIELEATPEQVWQAIATGPGMDSWFMGRTELEPREGGAVKTEMPGFTMDSTIGAWEPGRRLLLTSPQMAFEYLIEGRDGGGAVLRLVHSGYLEGDDWETEYDSLTKGDRMYLEKLAVYVKHFAPQASRDNLFVLGPQIQEHDRVWDLFRQALSLTGAPVAKGDKARMAVEGVDPHEGEVAFVAAPTYVGFRYAEGFISLLHGHGGTLVVEHHNFCDDIDPQALREAWEGWLAKQAA
jgi:Activator of Hsp90 ATPase homolog 1-like protein